MTDDGILDQLHQAEQASTAHAMPAISDGAGWLESSGHHHAIAKKQSIIDPSYRVRIAPAPVVLDEQGELVADAFIVSIRFPRETKDTLAGHVPVVTGSGVARILVGNTTIRRVPLC